MDENNKEDNKDYINMNKNSYEGKAESVSENKEPMQEKKYNRTANILSAISLLCILSAFCLSDIFESNMGVFYIFNGIAFIVLIYTRIKYPKNIFSKVLMIIFIILSVMFVIALLGIILFSVSVCLRGGITFLEACETCPR